MGKIEINFACSGIAYALINLYMIIQFHTFRMYEIQKRSFGNGEGSVVKYFLKFTGKTLAVPLCTKNRTLSVAFLWFLRGFLICDILQNIYN